MTRVVTLCLLAVTALAAQDRPDFSGRWILVASEPRNDDAPRALLVRQSFPSPNDISIVREFASETRSETHAIGLSGGSVSGISGAGAAPVSRSRYSVRWEGETLVFETGHSTGAAPPDGQWSEHREVWSRGPDGRLRVTITTRDSANMSGTTVTLTYRRP